MALHEFSKILITTLQGLQLLDGRFSTIRCVNVHPDKAEKRGCFSLVFSARDTTSGKQVALKFLDPDPRVTANLYRGMAFERESAILNHLLNSQRCLQLVQELKFFDIDLPLANGETAKVLCKYFAVEWLDQEIDDFFLSTGHGSIEKLRVFNNIILAVAALHRREVFHRDLKADNLRMSTEALA